MMIMMMNKLFIYYEGETFEKNIGRFLCKGSSKILHENVKLKFANVKKYHYRRVYERRNEVL